jgi:hydrogenase maturation protease
MMKTVIIGMGNPLLRDDGVGIRAVRALEPVVGNRRDVDLLELYTGGIRLMEQMAGYRRAFVVDAMVTGRHEPGTVMPFSLADFITTRRSISTHDTDFRISVEMAHLIGLPIPDDIRFWGVEAQDVDTFSEELTEPVDAAIPRILEQIMECLGRI